MAPYTYMPLLRFKLKLSSNNHYLISQNIMETTRWLSPGRTLSSTLSREETSSPISMLSLPRLRRANAVWPSSPKTPRRRSRMGISVYSSSRSWSRHRHCSNVYSRPTPTMTYADYGTGVNQEQESPTRPELSIQMHSSKPKINGSMDIPVRKLFC